MAKVRAERQENLLAVSLGEAALEIAREHLPEHVAEILANLAEAYADLQLLSQANACLDEADESLNRIATQLTRASPNALVAVQIARGRVCIATGNTAGAIATLEKAVGVAQQNEFSDMELVAHGLLAEVFKSLGRFEDALLHREACTRIHEQIFNRDTDLRIKTLQISHDTLAARDQAELLRVRTTELEELVTARTQDLEEQHYEAFERLAAIAEYRDPDSGEHSTRVGELAAELAIELGEDRRWAEELRLAGRLHDVGKVGVPDSILQKPGSLTDAEFDIMKTHTTVGARVFAGSRSTLLQLAAEVAISHHERWDGSGYPAGLAHDAIPLSGRLVAVADVYDALVTAHRYKHAWTSADAVATSCPAVVPSSSRGSSMPSSMSSPGVRRRRRRTTAHRRLDLHSDGMSAARTERIATRTRSPKWHNDPLRIEMLECINCDACLRACPPQFGAIFNHGPDVVIIPELCSGCDKCLPACPVNCIYPFPEWEATAVPGDWWEEPLTSNDPYV